MQKRLNLLKFQLVTTKSEKIINYRMKIKFIAHVHNNNNDIYMQITTQFA